MKKTKPHGIGKKEAEITATTLETSPEMDTLLRLATAKNGQTVTSYLLGLVEISLAVDLSEYAGLEDYAASVAGVTKK